MGLQVVSISMRLAMLALMWCISGSLLSFYLFDSVAVYLSPLTVINSKTAATCFIAGSLLFSFYSSLYFAEENFIIPSVLLLVINLVLIIFFIAGMQGLINDQWLLYAYFTGFLIQGASIALFYFLRKKDKAETLSSPGAFGKVLSYSSTVFLGNIIFFLVYRVDYWFVERYCSPARIG